MDSDKVGRFLRHIVVLSVALKRGGATVACLRLVGGGVTMIRPEDAGRSMIVPGWRLTFIVALTTTTMRVLLATGARRLLRRVTRVLANDRWASVCDRLYRT